MNEEKYLERKPPMANRRTVADVDRDIKALGSDIDVRIRYDGKRRRYSVSLHGDMHVGVGLSASLDMAISDAMASYRRAMVASGPLKDK